MNIACFLKYTKKGKPSTILLALPFIYYICYELFRQMSIIHINQDGLNHFSGIVVFLKTWVLWALD